MPNVGPLELAVVVIFALIIFGPKRLPELGKSLGKGIREFRSSISGNDDDDDDDSPKIDPGEPTAAPGEPAAAEPVEGEVVEPRP
jgi:sec-independent protein translocase protein TatA